MVEPTATIPHSQATQLSQATLLNQDTQHRPATLLNQDMVPQELCPLQPRGITVLEGLQHQVQATQPHLTQHIQGDTHKGLCHLPLDTASLQATQHNQVTPPSLHKEDTLVVVLVILLNPPVVTQGNNLLLVTKGNSLLLVVTQGSSLQPTKEQAGQGMLPSNQVTKEGLHLIPNRDNISPLSNQPMLARECLGPLLGWEQ